MMLPMFLSFIASLLGGFLFPWWWPAIVGAIVGFWKSRSGLRSVHAAAGGATAAWGALAAIYQIGNHGLLAGKVAAIFHLPGGWWLVLITAAVGGVTAGLGAWVGRYVRSAPGVDAIPK